MIPRIPMKELADDMTYGLWFIKRLSKPIKGNHVYEAGFKNESEVQTKGSNPLLTQKDINALVKMGIVVYHKGSYTVKVLTEASEWNLKLHDVVKLMENGQIGVITAIQKGAYSTSASTRIEYILTVVLSGNIRKTVRVYCDFIRIKYIAEDYKFFPVYKATRKMVTEHIKQIVKCNRKLENQISWCENILIERL
jgi:hypothetical protein